MALTILYIGRDRKMCEILHRLLNARDGWLGHVAQSDEEAREIFDVLPINIVLLGSGIDRVSETELRAYFVRQKPGIKIIQHYGGGSGLLYNEILSALDAS